MNRKGLTGAWIGASDSIQDGTWRDDNGNAVTYTSWNNGEPNGNTNENCAEMHESNGNWNDVDCNRKRTPVFEPAQAGPHSKYQVVDGTGLNWSAANEDAKKKNLQLAVPKNIDEVAQIQAVMNNKGVGSAWMGVSDREKDGTWKDVHGDVVSYTKWNAGEPNGGSNENCVEASGATGNWNDITCSANRAYILEPST